MKPNFFRNLAYGCYVLAVVVVLAWLAAPPEVAVAGIDLTSKLMAAILVALLGIGSVGTEIENQYREKARNTQIACIENKTTNLSQQMTHIPKPESIITKDALEAMLNHLNQENASLRQEMANLRAKIESEG